jgi:hypothetical protein
VDLLLTNQMLKLAQLTVAEGSVVAAGKSVVGLGAGAGAVCKVRADAWLCADRSAAGV